MLEFETDQFIFQIVQKKSWAKVVAIGFLKFFLLKPIVHSHPDETFVVTPSLGERLGAVIWDNDKIWGIWSVLEVKLGSGTVRCELGGGTALGTDCAWKIYFFKYLFCQFCNREFVQMKICETLFCKISNSWNFKIIDRSYDLLGSMYKVRRQRVNVIPSDGVSIKHGNFVKFIRIVGIRFSFGNFDLKKWKKYCKIIFEKLYNY